MLLQYTRSPGGEECLSSTPGSNWWAPERLASHSADLPRPHVQHIVAWTFMKYPAKACDWWQCLHEVSDWWEPGCNIFIQFYRLSSVATTQLMYSINHKYFSRTCGMFISQVACCAASGFEVFNTYLTVLQDLYSSMAHPRPTWPVVPVYNVVCERCSMMKSSILQSAGLIRSDVFTAGINRTGVH